MCFANKNIIYYWSLRMRKRRDGTLNLETSPEFCGTILMPPRTVDFNYDFAIIDQIILNSCHLQLSYRFILNGAQFRKSAVKWGDVMRLVWVKHIVACVVRTCVNEDCKVLFVLTKMQVIVLSLVLLLVYNQGNNIF